MKSIVASALLLATVLPWLRADPPVARGESPQGAQAVPDAGHTPPKITPFLWFDDDAEEAIAFWATIFPDTKLLAATRWGEGAPLPKGTLMTGRFRLAGQEFMALNGGPTYRLNEAFSLFVACETQEEIDRCWAKLGDGGEPGQCGWLKDRFGVSWQVVPTALAEMLADPDPAKAARVAAAMMSMTKLDLGQLRAAHAGR